MREPTQLDVRREVDGGLRHLDTPGSVVVIGAGLAGLATAHELAARGVDVTVLEASARPGGRAYTLREPFAEGLQVEAGAMTVTPHCHYVGRYVRELDVELGVADLQGTEFSYYVDSTFVRPDRHSLAAAGLGLHDHERGLDVGELVQRYVGDLCDELQPELGAPEWVATPALAPWDDRSVREVLRARGASDAAINLMEPMFLEMRGGDLTSASALAWLRHEVGQRSFTHSDEGWAKIAGGTDRLPQAFASRLGDRIRYRSPVVRVEQDEHRARIGYVDRGRLHTIEADRVVMTVPFSAMRHVDTADARLSADKIAAMRTLRYCSISRVHLQMRRKFWSAERLSISTDTPVRWIRDATVDAAGPRRIVECVMSGWRSRTVAAMSDEERVGFVLDHLESILPGAWEHLELGHSTVWDEQPYIEGAYVLPEKGHERLMPAIRRAEGRVHFAGEHTAFEPNGGSMNTALESAGRVLVELGEDADLRAA